RWTCVTLRRLPPSCTPFPYTTLFRSGQRAHGRAGAVTRARAVLAGCLAALGLALLAAPGTARADRAEVRVPYGGAYSLPVISLKDRKSTRLNSSHVKISYAVFCLKKK